MAWVFVIVFAAVFAGVLLYTMVKISKLPNEPCCDGKTCVNCMSDADYQMR